MQFLWTSLHVSDLEESLEFYCDRLGLSLQERFDGPLPIAFLGGGDTALELIQGQPEPSQGISLGFGVTDLAGWREKLSDANPSEIMSPAPEISFAFFTDPDGYLIQLVEKRSHD